MASTPKDNIDEKKPHQHWADAYVNFYTQRKCPISDRIVSKMAEELVTWARKDKNAFKLSQFYLDKGIPRSSFEYLVAHRPVLKEAYKAAKLLIGNRREVGAIKKKFDPGFVASQMAKYDDSWMTLEVQRAELKARTTNKGDSNVTYKVVVDNYEGTPPKDKKTDNIPEEPVT